MPAVRAHLREDTTEHITDLIVSLLIWDLTQGSDEQMSFSDTQPPDPPDRHRLPAEPGGDS